MTFALALMVIGVSSVIPRQHQPWISVKTNYEMPLSLNHLEKDKIVCIIIYIFLVNGYEFRYKKENNLDCQVYQDLHSLRSDGTASHDNCKAWCNSRYGCGAFALYRGTCYFKTYSCYQTYTSSSTAVLYLKFGNYLSQYAFLFIMIEYFTL